MRDSFITDATWLFEYDDGFMDGYSQFEKLRDQRHYGEAAKVLLRGLLKEDGDTKAVVEHYAAVLTSRRVEVVAEYRHQADVAEIERRAFNQQQAEAAKALQKEQRRAAKDQKKAVRRKREVTFAPPDPSTRRG